MAQTQDDFLFTIQAEGVPANSLFLFAITGSTTTEIQGIAVSINAKPTETSTDSEDISEVLEQVTRVYFEFTGDSIVLEVTDRSEYLDDQGNYFYYFQIEPYTFDSVLTQDEVSNVRVNFYPYIRGQSFYNSDYNAIQNSINDQKKSRFLQVSDRNTLSIQPTNLLAILNDFANKAEIPDSNYTDTGLVGARYKGTETSDLDYGSVPSTISGVSFVGSYYPTTMTSQDIQNLPQEDRVDITYLHTLNSRFPTFEVNSSRIRQIVPQPNLAASDTIIKYNQFPLNSPTTLNGLLLITGSAGREEVRIVNYDLDKKEITIKRDIGNTGAISFVAPNYSIFPIFENRIYELTGNKLNTIESGKILVKNTSVILNIDEFGAVYGQE
jgi:hypothetical protein